MIPIVNISLMPPAKRSRSYKSPLRDEQAEATRERILEAALRVLADGAAAFTMPAVAKAAGVSLPTVYRLFPNKEALTAGARAAVKRHFGIDESPRPSSAGIVERQLKHMRKVATVDDDLLRAQFVLNAEQLLPEQVTARADWIADGLKQELKGVRSKERKRLLNALSMLYSSAGAMMLWRFGLMNPEGEDTIRWMVETLVEKAKRSKRGKDHG